MQRHLAWVAMILFVAASVAAGTVQAAPATLSGSFERAWRAGEERVPNFWGPLATARSREMEPYRDASIDYSEGGPSNLGQGWRVVQYFDKARMEINAPAADIVTNGLLAVELISGRVQIGNTSFEARQPATIPVAGDPDNPGPTYAMLQANASLLLDPAVPQSGRATTLALAPTGTVTTFAAGANYPPAMIADYDATTKHTIPRAFADYRQRVGIAAIGLAISEPFWSEIKVAGVTRNVLMQAFERRVLTYTPANPAAFQIEFGNIGQHYYRWRYNIGSPMNAVVSLSPITATGGNGVGFTASVAACLTVQTRAVGTTAAWQPDPATDCTPGTALQRAISPPPGAAIEARGAARDASGIIVYTPDLVILSRP